MHRICECESFPTGSPSRYDSYQEGEETVPNPTCPVHTYDDDYLSEVFDAIHDTYGLVHANNGEWVTEDEWNPETGDPLPKPGQPYPFDNSFIGRWAEVYGKPGKRMIIGEDSKGMTLLFSPPRGITHEDFWDVAMTDDPPTRIVAPTDVPENFHRDR